MFNYIEIRNFVVKKFTRRDVFFFSLIVILFLASRLINLTKFPIFNDEGIYIQWAKIAWHDASWRFISLTDGKQPLQTWGTIPFLKLFPNDALLAGRLFAVATGFASLIGLFLLLFYMFGKKSAYIGSLLYIFTPYFLFYDRLALADSGVNAGFIWIFFFSLLLVDLLRLDVALFFGLIGGIALLTKSSAQVFLALGIFGPVTYFFQKNNKKTIVNKMVNYYLLYFITIILAFVIYNVQRLSPFFHFVTEKNKVFLLSFDEFIKTPFMVFWHNVTTLPLYTFWEMGFVLGFLGLFGWFQLRLKDKKAFIRIFYWIITLYFGVCFFTRILYPRYLIFFSTLFLILTASLLSQLKHRLLIFLSIVALIVSFSFFDYPILFDIKNIPFPPVDRGQYLHGWTAGWGIKEIVEYARLRTQEKPVVILAEGDFGMTGDVLNVYIRQNEKIFVKGYWPLNKKNILDNKEELKKSIVLVVFFNQKDSSITNNLKLINSYPKPQNESSIDLYELNYTYE